MEPQRIRQVKAGEEIDRNAFKLAEQPDVLTEPHTCVTD